MNPDETEAILSKALDLGIAFFDTANTYAHGASEESLGRAIKRNVPRGKVVFEIQLKGSISVSLVLKVLRVAALLYKVLKRYASLLYPFIPMFRAEPLFARERPASAAQPDDAQVDVLIGPEEKRSACNA